MGSIIKAFFNAIYKLTLDTINILIYPTIAFVNSLFPDLSTYISTIQQFLLGTIVPVMAWFTNLLPPITKAVILLWLGFLLVYYTAVWTYTLSMKIFNIIHKIKFW